MDKNDIVRFLEAIDAELVPHAAPGERMDLYLLGRSALIVRYGLGLATKDVDMVWQGEISVLHTKAIELFGQGTSHAIKWGLYLERVAAGYPPVPGRYQRMAAELPGTWKVLRPKQLDPHDLAISKLKRFHAGDREDLRILCDSGDLTRTGLEQALDSAFPLGTDEDAEPDYKRVEPHFRKLLEYLEGQSRDL
jgi:hypothetical protein